MVSTLATMVLGLLAEGERHGYDLMREMDARGMLRWTRVSKVGVYKALARLEGEGSLTSWTERQGGLPERRVYAITAAGEEKLKDLVYAICASREPLRLDAAIGLAFLDRLEPREAVDALQQRREFLVSQARRLARERAILRELADDMYLDILAREQSAYREEMRWLNGIIARIESGGTRMRAAGRSRKAGASRE